MRCLLLASCATLGCEADDLTVVSSDAGSAGPVDAGSAEDAGSLDAGNADLGALDAGPADLGPSTPTLPAPHPDFVEAATWGAVRFPSGARIGECLSAGPDGLRLERCAQATGWRWRPDPSQLEVESGCLSKAGAVVPCAEAPKWVLDAHRRLVVLAEGDPAPSCLGTGLSLVSCGAPEAAVFGAETMNAPLPDALFAPAGTPVSVQPDADLEPMQVFGADARPLVGDGHRALVAAGTVGQGRVLVMSGFGALTQRTGDAAWESLAQRSLAWLTDGAASPRGAHRTRELGLVRALGYPTTRIGQIDPGELDDVDFLVIFDNGAPETLEAEAEVVKAFLRRGGAVLVRMRKWLYWEVDRNLPYEHLAARVASWAGIGPADADGGTVDGPRWLDRASAEERSTTELAEAAARSALGLEPRSEAELEALADRAAFAIGRPLDTELGRLSLAVEALNRVRGPVAIGPDQHHEWNVDPVADIHVCADYVRTHALPVEQVGVHPSGLLYPGPLSAAAPRVSVSRTLDLSAGGTRWRPTGLYAPPGEAIELHVPSSLLFQGFRVRIGGADDTPMPQVGWANPRRMGRFPHLAVGRPLAAERVRFGSPFGGLIYVSVPNGADLGPTELSFDHVVEAPWFRLGTTTAAEWAQMTSGPTAPMGEMTSDLLHLSAETRVLSTITEPARLMTLWRDVVDAHAQLVGETPDLFPNKFPQRFHFDPWESWGAHSGFPIHLAQDWTEEVLDLNLLLAGDGEHWGPMHELGHNFQREAWTFSGWGEVTCNIHVVHACEKVLGLSKEACGSLSSNREASRARYFGSDVAYDSGDWQVIRSGLDMFLLIQEANQSWAPLERVFRRYRDLPSAQIPRTDVQKVDTLVRFFSEDIGRNMVPFFSRFKLPISAGLAFELSALPAWENDPLRE